MTDPELFCNIPLGGAVRGEFSYLPYFRVVQNTVKMLFSDWSKLPSFIYHVIHIVLSISRKEMIRIAAPPHIAFMKYVDAFWNWTVCNLVSYAVGTGMIAMYFGFSISSFFVYGHFPKPALVIGFNIHSRPKPFFKRGLFGPPFIRTFNSPFNSLLMCFHINGYMKNQHGCKHI